MTRVRIIWPNGAVTTLPLGDYVRLRLHEVAGTRAELLPPGPCSQLAKGANRVH